MDNIVFVCEMHLSGKWLVSLLFQVIAQKICELDICEEYLYAPSVGFPVFT